MSALRAPQFDTSHQPFPDPETPPDEYKASYDDLIDDYSAPYAPNSRHQTFAIGSPHAASHRRGNSASMQKASASSFSLKHSDDTHDTHAPCYPPVMQSKEKEVDTRTVWQKIIPESVACRLYLATVLVETTIDLAIEGELFLRVQEKVKADQSALGEDAEPTSRRMPVYLAIFALAHVFQFIMALDAVYARNTLQFICLAIFNALFLMYAIIQIGEVQTAMAGDSSSVISSVPIHVLTIIIPIVISVAEIAYIALGWKIYHEFGWKVYKFLGADRRIKKLYANYQIYECLVKFDVFFWVGFSVQFIWLVLSENDWEYYVTCAALPLSIILLVEGHLAARHENKWMMATFMSGCVGAMIYFIYKLIKVLLDPNGTSFRLVWKSLTVFSVFSISLLIATFVYSVIILRNFGKGLKNALKRKADQGFNSQNHRRAASATLNRMSIT
ncbi:hypothetical protein D9611_003175 [Ephemerocybe angulata]|uniref:Uncharacterized protein n=2 Tax=Ephemerocybe angulata TaxID=980116 RepID=A0A8H6MGS8_9AGAR|nr:hypothetical protein D9611_003175 [Tulosesus angulatus]KAF6766189.1 hypothetical protein DFP72DRAFT_796790 [Tulosesus angulatus]